MELVASKCYHPSGIITIVIFFQKVIYVSVMEGGNENPLLDSRFPDVSAKGRGYQLQSYPEGIEGWPSLRRVTIWQTVAALEMEFRERAAKFAEAKRLAESRQNNPSQSLTSNNDGKEDDDKEGEEREETIAVGKSFNDEEEKSEKSSKKSEKAAGNGESLNNNNIINDDDDDRSNVADSKDNDNDDDVLPTRGSKSSAKSSTIDLKESVSSSKISDDSNQSQSATSPTLSRFSVARPHHIPKLESLSKKLDQIRAEMGDEVLLIYLY